MQRVRKIKNKPVEYTKKIVSGPVQCPSLRNISESYFSESGFTLMEIMVATTIFAFVTVAMTSLFSYTLKINRRAEALRQATQGMRNFVEFVVKEIRNGQIDYSVNNAGTSNLVAGPIGPCPRPANSLPVNSQNRNDRGNIYGQMGGSNYADNALGIITPEGDRECIYLADGSGTRAVGFTGSKVVINKNNTTTEDINPPNFTVNYLVFYIRPLLDPYTNLPVNSVPKTQPSVSFSVNFTAKLPTGETVPIYYQTSVSSDKYDIPNQ